MSALNLPFSPAIVEEQSQGRGHKDEGARHCRAGGDKHMFREIPQNP